MKKGLLTEQEDRRMQDEVEKELVSTIKESEKVRAPDASLDVHGRLR